MITFIVIGLNEGWKLTKCIDSIYNEIQNYKHQKFEVIYIDSQSDDDSIARALKYPDLKVFQITGKCNPAIARNIGAVESKGNLLFFLDGDMELCQGFLEEAINLYKLNYRFISGQIRELFYNRNREYLGDRMIFSNQKLNTFNLTNGGAFVIDKALWKSAGGMRTKYARSQDIDLNYRLVMKGFPIFRSERIIVKHHTIQYNFDIKLTEELKNFSKYLFRGVLIRDHILNYKIFLRNARINYSLFVFIISAILSGFLRNALFTLIYFSLVVFRSARQYIKFKQVLKSGYFKFLLRYVYQDITGIIGLFFYYPTDKPLSYKEIQ